MSKALKLLSIISLLSLAGAQAGFAKGYRGGPHGHHKHWLKELNLTPEQKAQMKEIRAKYKENLQKLRIEKKDARIMLRAALKTSASESKLKQMFADLQKKKQTFAKARFEKILAIRSILTPEQRQKFNGLKGKGWHHKRNGKGHHRPRP